MRLTLASLCLAVALATSVRADLYARWEFHQLGAHPLPFEWQNYGGGPLEPGASYTGSPAVVADFSGLAALANGVHTYSPVSLFDVHTGEKVPLSPELAALAPGSSIPPEEAWFIEVNGPYALTERVGSPATRWLYDHTSHTFNQIADQIGFTDNRGILSSGHVVLNQFEWNGFETIGYLEVWPTGQRIHPPWQREVVPGVLVSTGALEAVDASDAGWVAGTAGTAAAGFVLHLETGEFHELPFIPAAVNDVGQVASLPSADERTYQLWDPQTQQVAVLPLTLRGSPLVLNNQGQAVAALALDDDGRILRLAGGETYQVPDVTGGFNTFRDFHLVVGEPLLIAGDYDASGQVDQGDLDVLLLNWGASERPATWVHDTGSYDGRVDQNELDRVLLRWGATDGVPALSSPLSAAGSIPEPPTSVLTFLFVLAVGFVTRHWFNKYMRLW